MGTTTDYKEKYLKSFFKWQAIYENASKRTKELEKKLKIAKEALKQYADKGNWQDCLDWNGYMEDCFVVEKGQFGENGYTVAEEALKEIKG